MPMFSEWSYRKQEIRVEISKAVGQESSKRYVENAELRFMINELHRRIEAIEKKSPAKPKKNPFGSFKKRR